MAETIISTTKLRLDSLRHLRADLQLHYFHKVMYCTIPNDQALDPVLPPPGTG